MTLPYVHNAICSVCGTEKQVYDLASTNTFGSPDLDLRPPEMIRSTMEYWIHRCENCGYVSGDLTEEIPVSKEFIKTERYLSFGDHEPLSEIGSLFIQKARISVCAEDFDSAAKDYIHAAWCADDASDEYWSKQGRLFALEMMEKQDRESDETQLALKADLLRKTGQFEQLIQEYERLVFADEVISKILKFQIMKAKAHDTKTYTVENVVSAID